MLPAYSGYRSNIHFFFLLILSWNEWQTILMLWTFDCWLYDCVFQISRINRKFTVVKNGAAEGSSENVCVLFKFSCHHSLIPHFFAIFNAEFYFFFVHFLSVFFLFSCAWSGWEKITKKKTTQKHTEHINVWIDWNNSNCTASQQMIQNLL